MVLDGVGEGNGKPGNVRDATSWGAFVTMAVVGVTDLYSFEYVCIVERQSNSKGQMMLTLIGTLLGGIFRLVPELFKFLDAKNDRQHEIDMFNLQLEADRLKAEQSKDLARIQNEGAATLADIQAVIEATKAQSQLTGVKFVDGFNAIIRPFLTFYWCVVLYTLALAAEFYSLVYLSKTPMIDAVLSLWGQDEKAIVASIFSFWFVDRALRKNSGR